MTRDTLPSIAPRLHFAAATESSNATAARPTAVETWLDGDGAVFARCGAEGGRYWMDLPALGTFRFDGHGDRVIAAARPGVGAGAIAEAYWHAALPLVLQARGTEVLHASAVRTSGGVVAFCGASRSGKSTIAYGLHRRGYGSWADDAVAFDVSASATAARPLPFDVRLRPAAAALFGLGPGAARLAGPDEGPRSGGVPLAAVCLLDRGPASGAALTALGPSVAYPGILAHAFCFSLADPARKRLMLDRYLSLVARIPIFALRLPDGLEHLPALLDEVERAFGDIASAVR